MTLRYGLDLSAVFTYIVGATALSSLLGGAYYAFRLFRYNEV